MIRKGLQKAAGRRQRRWWNAEHVSPAAAAAEDRAWRLRADDRIARDRAWVEAWLRQMREEKSA